METDRIETNLGATADQEVPAEPQPEAKQPRRRFVGRRTAQQLVQAGAISATEDVESSSIIQRKPTEWFIIISFSDQPKCLNREERREL
jgi:hypothetical protein